MPIYSFKNGSIVEAGSKEQAILSYLKDNCSLASFSSLKAELKYYNKLLRSYFNVSQGTNDSLLIMKCNSKEGAKKLKDRLYTLPLVKHAKLTYRVNLKAFAEENYVYSYFTPKDYVLKCGKVNLTLSEFLYVTQSHKMIDIFMSKYGFKDEDNDKIQFGGAHITAMTDLCRYFRKYKERLFVNMIKPKNFKSNH